MQTLGKDIPAVILAGGAGRRMGGGKPDVLLAGRPLWRHVADRVGPQVAVLAVNGPVPAADHPQVADTRPGLGPLSGILAAMLWARERGAMRVLSVAVDTPFLPQDLVTRLAGASAPVVMARTIDGTHGTTALWDVALADDLDAYLQDGGRKVTAWARGHDIAYVDFPETTPPAFFNVNTPEDLARAEAWA